MPVATVRVSLVVSMPPSPPVVMILSWQKEKAATSPDAIRPDAALIAAPCACAQSSTTYRPCSLRQTA